MSVNTPPKTPEARPVDPREKLEALRQGILPEQEKAQLQQEQKTREENLRRQLERNEMVKNMPLATFLSSSPEHRLENITNPPLALKNLENGIKFQTDFHGNDILEHWISLADVMPPGVREVTVTNEEKTLNGTRRGMSGEFFTEKGQRLLIFTDTTIQIGSFSAEAARQKIQDVDEEVKAYDLRTITGEEAQVVKKAVEKGLDPKLALALYQAQIANGQQSFGLENQGLEGFDLQLEMALKMIGRYEGSFSREYPGIPLRIKKEVNQRTIENYTPEFVSYFLKNFAADIEVENKEEFYQQFSSTFAPGDPDFFQKGQRSLEEKVKNRVKAFMAEFFPQMESKETPAEKAEFLQSLTAEQIWHIEDELGPENLRWFLKENGLYELTLTREKILDSALQAVEQFPITGDREADAETLTKILWHESVQGKIFAVSPSGALGIAQMMEVNYLTRWNFNPFDPEKAILHAAQHLHEDYPRLGNDLEKTIVAYNSGVQAVINAVAKANAAGNPAAWESYLPHAENRNYLDNVNQITELKMKLFGGNSYEVEGNLESVELFGKEIRVHRLLTPFIQRVNRSVNDWSPDGEIQTFNWRNIRGYEVQGDNYLSNHSFGIALDIDPSDNAMGQRSTTIPRHVIDAFKAAGFDWGGDWTRRPDPMHFELSKEAIMSLAP